MQISRDRAQRVGSAFLWSADQIIDSAAYGLRAP